MNNPFKDSITISVTVKANAKKNSLEWNSNKKQFLLSIKEPAEDNKANKEIIRFFRKEFGTVIKIKSGLSSKQKILQKIE